MVAECSDLPAARSSLQKVEEQIRILETERAANHTEGLLPQLRERQMSLRDEIAAAERLCRPRFETIQARRQKVEAWQEMVDARLGELSARRDSGDLTEQQERSERRRLQNKRRSYERELRELRYRERYLHLCLTESQELTSRELKKRARGGPAHGRAKKRHASRDSVADQQAPGGSLRRPVREKRPRLRRFVLWAAALIAAAGAAAYLFFPTEMTSALLRVTMPPEAKERTVTEAVAQAGNGELSAAAAGLERVLQAYPEDSSAAFELVSVYVLEGRLDEAAALCRTVLQQQPENEEAIEWLALIEADPE